MGKDYIEGDEKTLDSADGSNINKVIEYFGAPVSGYYQIVAIAGGGGGIGDSFGSTNIYGEAGEHGQFRQEGYWVENGEIGYDNSFKWFYIGSGGDPSDTGNADDGSYTRINLDAGGTLFSLSGGEGGSYSNSTSNSSIADAGVSPWTTAGYLDEKGKGGNGARFGNGRVADPGNGGAIIVKRLW